MIPEENTKDRIVEGMNLNQKKLKCEDCGMEIEIDQNYEPIPGDLILCETCFKKSPLSGFSHSSLKRFQGKITRHGINRR